ERRDVGPLDVRIEIQFAGICHSDIHTARAEWGGVQYPLDVGHEIAGVVAEVGCDVAKFAVGDRVGVGRMVISCVQSVQWEKCHEQYCLNGNIGTYSAKDVDGTITQGGYAEQIVVTEKFVLSIPDGLELDVAAPLL